MKVKKIIALLTAAFLLLSALVGCGQTSTVKTNENSQPASGTQPASSNQTAPAAEQNAPKPIKLAMWCSAYYTPEETKKPQEEWMISKAIKQFEAQNPNVKIDLNITTPSPETFAKFKAAAMAKNGPDIINLWSGSYLFPMKDVLLKLNDLIPKEDLENITAWDAVTYNFQKGGDILAYPVGTNFGVLIYNKQLITKAGLDFDTNPPKTTEEFTKALEAIKATGVLPLGQDAASGSMILHAAGYWWVQKTGYDGLVKLGNGETKFADDKGLTDMLKYCQSLYKAGFVNKDAATSADSGTRFYSGKTAIRTGGTWDLKDAQAALGEGNVGILALPGMVTSGSKVDAQVVGGAGDCTAIANYTKNPEMAVKFLSFLNSKQVAIEVCKNMGCFPVRKDITFEDLGWSDPLHKQLVEYSQHTAFWIDNSLPADYINEVVKFFPNCFVGKMSAEELAAQVDKKVAETLKK